MQINSKLPAIGTTIFSVMSGLAKEYNAINLSQGFPDFGCDAKLLDFAQKHMSAGFNQYAPMPGLLSLREKIAQKTYDLYSAQYDANSEITIVPGATHGIYAIMSAMIREGDEVIVIEPCYDSYVPAIELNGGRAIHVELKLPEFKIDWNEVKKLINFKTKMILINTPHNPTGSILNAQDLQKLEK